MLSKWIQDHLWWFAGAALILFFGAALLFAFKPEPKISQSAPAVLATPSPEVKHEVKTDVPAPKTVKVYKAAVKDNLKLPAETVSDPLKAVTDSSVVASSEHPQQVTQVLDTETGETKTYVADAPLPWVAPESRGNVSVDYGLKRGSLSPVGRLNVHEDILEIKALHFGADASVYSDGDYFVGLGVSYRW